MEPEPFDHVVLGAGLRGLGAALRQRRAAPGATLLVVDAAARAGGQVQTQRSNGFVCELGPFAFLRQELEPVLAQLDAPPRLVEPLAEGRRGWRFDGAGLVPTEVEPVPVACPSGNEELVQACRRALGPALRLGRPVTALLPHGAGVDVVLGGDVASRLRARKLTLALPAAAAAALLAPFDRALTPVAARLGGEPRAFVFLGGHAGDAPELRGYGIVPDPTVATAVAEVIVCTQVFAQRALPGRCLVRIELAASGDDAALVAAASTTLAQWTGTQAAWPFTKVHRFVANGGDPAAAVECRARLAAVAAHLQATLA